MIESTLTSSVLIVLLIAFRYVLKGRIGFRLQYALWLIVALRLLLPFSLVLSPVSILNAVHAPVVEVKEAFAHSLPNEAGNRFEGQGDSLASAQRAVQAAAGTGAVLTRVFTIVWIAGMAVLLLGLVLKNLLFYRRLKKGRSRAELENCKLDVYWAEHPPCLFGLLKPAIYLPRSVFNETQLNDILAHECTHYAQGDAVWAYVRSACVILHWFNPLVWVAAVLSRQDCELACDEGTLRRIGEANRVRYGELLITMAAKRSSEITNLLAVATSLGRTGIKERITIIAKKPKTHGVLRIAAVAIAIAAAVCTFTGAEASVKQTQAANTIAQNSEPTHDAAQEKETAEPIDEANTAQNVATHAAQEPALADENTIVHYKDLTHDGTDEKIVVDLTYVDSLFTGEEQTVRVYNGDKLIFTEHADTAHVGWNGIYLYKGDDGWNLMLWKPYGATGSYDFTYEVFYLAENGEKISMDSEELHFDDRQEIKNPGELKQKITAYGQRVNAYLAKSWALIDTDGGSVLYSTEQNKVTRLYDVTRLLGELGIESASIKE